MTAVDKNGNEVFKDERIFMPTPQRLGRGNAMGRGPYEKSGMIADSSLPPLRTVKTSWEIFFPVEETEKDDEVVRTYPSDTLDIDVKLWYLPYGTMDTDPFLWREHEETVKVNTSDW